MIYHYLESVDSTNNELKRRLNTPDGGQIPEEFTVISANEQTGGRGRSGHSWSTPAGTAIATSMICYPGGLSEDALPQLTIVAAIAVCRAVEAVSKLPTGLKWVNDVLMEGKKISGILVEHIPEYSAVITGIGINVRRGSYPPELNDMAVSIEEVMAAKDQSGSKASGADPVKLSPGSLSLDKVCDFGANDPRMNPDEGRIDVAPRISRKKLVEILWRQYLSLYERFISCSSLSFVIDEYERRLVNLGRTVVVSDPKSTFTAAAIGINEGGSLIVQKSSTGEVLSIDSGEVHIRGMEGYV